MKYIGSATIRGVEIAQVDIIPVEYCPGAGVRFIEKIVVTLEHPPAGNPTRCDDRLYHPAFEALYRSMLVNPDAAVPEERSFTFAIEEWDSADGAELLVISYPEFTDELAPWIEWKLEMGIPTKVVPVPTGTSLTSIKSFIRNAYDTWTIPPVYLLIFGDNEHVPAYDVWGGCHGDNDHCTVDGTDIFPDIFPGRISGENGADMDNIIRKHLDYEMRPDTVDGYLARAVGIVNEDDPTWDPLGPQDSSYLAAVNYGMGQCTAAGFTDVQIFRRKDGDNFYDVQPYVEAGLGFVQYRGQAYPDYYYGFRGGLDTLENNGKCPVNISISCGTGDFLFGDNNMCERCTRAGTAANPKGAVTFMGQSMVSSNSEERSSLSKHIFQAMFEEGIDALAAAHTFGKNEMFAEFGGSGASRYEYLSAVYMGSPELRAWTAPILTAHVTYPTVVSVGPFDIEVSVTRAGVPLENARVAVHTGESFSSGLTNSLGDVTIPVNVAPGFSPILVVTGPNIYPFSDTLILHITGVGIICAHIDFDDVHGNHDGLINPGETISFCPKIVNIGSVGASGLVAVLRNGDVVISDSTTSFPFIAPGDTVEGDSVSFVVPQDTPGSTHLDLTLEISGHPDGPWTRNVNPQPFVHRMEVVVDSIIIMDAPPFGNGNGMINPGETVDICLWLANSTSADGYNLEAILHDIPYVSVIQPNGHADSIIRASTVAVEPCFSVSISPAIIPDGDLEFAIAVTAECSIYTYLDTVRFELSVSGNSMNLPSGPDDYGYLIIDDTDSITGIAPVFEWNSIASPANKIDEITDEDDAYIDIPLPFDISYYGATFDRITVGSNGFLYPGPDFTDNVYPVEIPSSDGPAGVIAPLWADLAPHRTDGGDIYSAHDAANHQFVIQWNMCRYYYDPGRVSCQVRICDPVHWLTPTDDSEIFIYYNEITLAAYAAVGIESPSETDGIEYYFEGDYEENAEPIIPGRALRITTLDPVISDGPWLFYFDELTFSDAEGNDNGIIDPNETLGMRLRVKNGGTDSAYVTSGSVIDFSPYIDHEGLLANFGNIGPGATAANSTDWMKFRIDASCPADTLIEVPVQLDDATGYSTIIKVLVPVGSPTGISEKPALPEGISLRTYPNPFNSTVKIRVQGFEGSSVRVEIYNIAGRMVAPVTELAEVPGDAKLPSTGSGSGIRTIVWQPDKSLGSGIYLVKVTAGEEELSRKIVLIK